MTDTDREPGTWVPRLGALEVSADRAGLIRGLYQLAAWIADHPELPVPRVAASIIPDGGWEAECAVVDLVADALGVAAELRPGGAHYRTEGWFGPVEVSCTAITAEHPAAHQAYMSYAGSLTPVETDGSDRPGGVL